jgi:hypothetical protein
MSTQEIIDTPEIAGRRRPVPAIAAAVGELVLGTVTSVAGTVFATAAGGAWYLGTALVPVALVLWWMAGLGLLRGTRRGITLSLFMLGYELAFGVFKLVVYGESAAYVFMSVSLVALALVLAPSTRAWAQTQTKSRTQRRGAR